MTQCMIAKYHRGIIVLVLLPYTVMVKLKLISPNPLLYMVLGQNHLKGNVNEARAITPEDSQS